MSLMERNVTRIFGRLAQQNQAVGESLEVRAFSAGETICEGEEMAGSLFLVASGRVQLYRTDAGRPSVCDRHAGARLYVWRGLAAGWRRAGRLRRGPGAVHGLGHAAQASSGDLVHQRDVWLWPDAGHGPARAGGREPPGADGLQHHRCPPGRALAGTGRRGCAAGWSTPRTRNWPTCWAPGARRSARPCRTFGGEAWWPLAAGN